MSAEPTVIGKPATLKQIKIIREYQKKYCPTAPKPVPGQVSKTAATMTIIKFRKKYGDL